MTTRMRVIGETCHYCDEPAATRDHVVPRAVGGKNGAYNIVPSCTACNHAKANAWPTCPCEFCENAKSVFATYDSGPNEVLATLGEFAPTLGAAIGEAAERLLQRLKGSPA